MVSIKVWKDLLDRNCMLKIIMVKGTKSKLFVYITRDAHYFVTASYSLFEVVSILTTGGVVCWWLGWTEGVSFNSSNNSHTVCQLVLLIIWVDVYKYYHRYPLLFVLIISIEFEVQLFFVIITWWFLLWMLFINSSYF